MNIEVDLIELVNKYVDHTLSDEEEILVNHNLPQIVVEGTVPLITCNTVEYSHLSKERTTKYICDQIDVRFDELFAR